MAHKLYYLKGGIFDKKFIGNFDFSFPMTEQSLKA